jgi:hypothetical protein
VATFLGKGWKYPAELDRGGGVATSEEEESIRQSMFIILGTAHGERVMRPDFGCEIHELLYAPNNLGTAGVAAHYCQVALLKWEPRIKDIDVQAAPSRDEPNRLDVQIRYRVRGTNVSRNFVYPFYLRKSDEP